MRQALGTAVLFGMLGVTCFGLLFTPAFYTFIRKLGRTEHEDGLSMPALPAWRKKDREVWRSAHPTAQLGVITSSWIQSNIKK